MVCVALTPKQVHGSCGGQVDPSRTCPGRGVGVALAHTPPLPCPAVVTETELATLTQEA